MSESNATPVGQPRGNRFRAIAAERYGGALAVPAFRWLWLLSLFSATSDAIATVAMPLLVYDMTDSSRMLGFMFVLQQIPRVLLSPVAGVVADRINRRTILLWSALFRASIAALIPLMGGIWQIAALAMLLSAASAIARPAEMAALPAILSGSAFIQGLSLIQVTNNTMRIVGPAAGAAMIGLTGPGPAFWLQTICLCAAAAAARRLILPEIAQTTVWTGWKSGLEHGWSDIAEGLKLVARTPLVRGIIAADSFWSFVSAAMVVTAVVYTEKTLDLGDRAATVYGAITAIFSLGAVMGALLASRVEQRFSRGTLLAIGFCGPLLWMPMVLTPPLPVVFVIWFVFGIADALAVVAMQSYLAEAVSDAYRGRVYATWIASVTTVSMATFALVGWVTPIFGPSLTFTLVGIVTGIGGPFLLWVTGALAAVRHPKAKASP
jgi:NRE family putative nickel resistance protein-like MFS transporter